VIAALIEQGAVSEEGPQKAVPLGRWAAPAEIAEVIVFLCSEKASYISGEEILVDGGVIHKTHF
jgi:3-oxoacyl-[acyl-carrier protein] reductase